MSQVDSGRFFEDPVREEDAPGYKDVIKRPMSFSAMREKLKRRQYENWKGFVEDFELICNNAMVYNQKRSKIHKCAVAMLRQGKKVLQQEEMFGRKAFAILNPGGSIALSPPLVHEVHLFGGSAAANQAVSGRKPSNLPSFSPPPKLQAAQSMSEGAFPREASEDLQFEFSSGDDEAYSSFSDTDLDEEEPCKSSDLGVEVLPLAGNFIFLFDLPLVGFRIAQSWKATASWNSVALREIISI